jgi:cell division protease FtsH
MAEHPVTRFRRLLRPLLARARRRPRMTLLSVLLLAVAIGATGMLIAIGRSTPLPAPTPPAAVYSATWSLADLTRHADAGDVTAVTVPRSAAGEPPAPAILVARTRDGALVRVDLTVDPGAAASALASLGHGDLLTADAWAVVRSPRADSSPLDPVRTVLGWIVPVALITLLILVFTRMARGGSSREGGTGFMTILPGRRRADDGPPNPDAVPAVRLVDVAGCEEAKLELTETIEFLRSPARFQKLGARIPHGVLLFGPPGTGKTMLARAVAAEAEVPFLAASGAEFIEKYVGVGSRRVRELFAQARSHGRAVIFIDEFDALGKARGGANSHEEREQTLNQLLIELDGFTSTEGVVVIAATNRVDVLDPAVLRPGRFGRKIHVGLPDVVGRREILAVHSRGKPFEPTVDLDIVARKTYGFSGAQLADLLNEAAILAARRKSDVVGADDVHGGWLKVAVGAGRRRSMDERERSIIAAHEVGHAICGRIHGDRRRVEEISLFAHGEALGVTVSSQEDNDLPAESDLRARLVALMGGRAAEELLFHEVTGGAANDFEQANRMATSMVTRWGMGRDPESNEHGTSGRGSLSFLVARSGGTLPSEVQAAATRATRAILDEAYAEACRTLLEHMDLLRRLAAYLVEHERVDGDTFDALVDGKIEVPNALLEWRPAAARPRAWADIPIWHAGRGKPVALPLPVAATSPSILEPAPQPIPVPVTVPIPIGAERRRLPRERHRTVAGQLSRRLRRLAVGYVDGAKHWFWSGEGDPES